MGAMEALLKRHLPPQRPHAERGAPLRH